MAEKPTYEELEQRIAKLEIESAGRKRFEEINHVLFKISSAVNATFSLDELFRSIHLTLSPIIETTNFFIALYDRTKDSITFPYCVDTVDESYPPVIEVSKTASLTAEVIRTGLPVFLTKPEILSQRAKSNLKIPACTPAEVWIGVPLKTREEIIGVMAVQSYNDPTLYDQTDMDVMVSVADQVAIAVERKRAEEALRDSQERLRLVSSSIPGAIYQFVKRKDGVYEIPFMSEGAVSLLERPISELQDATLLFEGVHPDDVEGIWSSIANSANSLTQWEREFRIVGKTGTLKWLRGVSSPSVLPDGSICWNGVLQDITNRKTSEEALRHNQAMLARTESIAHVGSWEWDVATDTVTWSKEMFRIFQRNPADGVPSFAEHPDLYDPEDMQRLRKAVEDAVSTGKPYKIELRAIRKDGATRICRARGHAEMGPGGKATRLFGSLQDITDLKRAEQDYKMLFREILDGFALHEIICNEAGNPVNYRFLAVNPAFERMTGLKADEITGKTVLDILPGIERHWIETYGNVALSGKPTFFENYSDDLKRYFQVTAFQPASKQFACIFNDITDRKQAEGLLKDEIYRWRILFEKSRDGIVILDQTGKVFEANKRYADMLGYSMEEISQLHVWDWDAQFSKEQIKEMIRSIDDAGAHFQTRQRRKDGTIIDVELSNSVTVYKEHKLVFCICRDITDRKNAEKSLIRLNRLYSVLSQINAAIIRIRQPEELFAQACRIAVEAGNLIMAWIGLLDPETLKINPVARWGIDDGYVDNLNLSAADVPEGQGQTGITVREGKYSICPDWHNDPKMHLWKEKGMARGYRSSMAFPLQMENQIIGAMSLYAGETNFFSEDEVKLLKPLADNLSYALSFMEKEKQRRQMETFLRENEERYRTILQTAMDGFLIVDFKGHIWDVNASYCRMSGYSKEELLGMQLSNLEVDETPEITIRHMEKVKAQGADRFETRHRRKDGSIIDVEVSVQCGPHDADRLIVFLRDITEHRVRQKALLDSEYRFRRISRLTNDIAFSCSDHENGVYSIDWMFGNSLNIFGYSIEEIKERSCWRFLVTEEDDPIFVKNVIGLSPGQSASAELRLMHKNGSIVWIASYTECEPDNSRFGHRCLFGGLQDITARKKADAEKAILEDQLRQSQKMESIGTLAGGIAHDLNNILFPITGLSEMLLDEFPPGSSVYANLQQIHRSAMRGSELVKQILSFSRQSSPQKLPIRLQPILKEVMKLSRATVPTNIKITSDIKSECGMVFADPTHIHQILMNLVTNAYHAVEKTGGAIHIALKEAALDSNALSENSIKPGKYACIIVSDTGTGIDQTLINKIFEPYFTTKELGKGTGLGLSVVHGIVKQHGGDIRVSSQIGKGSTFQIYLPLLEDSRDTKAGYVSRGYPTGTESILLIDDEEPIVRTMQMMLKRLGYQVTVRTSSPDALDAFSASPSKFDLVISDRGMPNMTGEQLAREIILIKPEIPIILCTGFSDENDEKCAMEMGVRGFLKKPVATGDLAEMVRKVLDEAKGTTQD